MPQKSLNSIGDTDKRNVMASQSIGAGAAAAVTGSGSR